MKYKCLVHKATETTNQLTSAGWLQTVLEGMTGDSRGTDSESRFIQWSCPTAGLLNLLPVNRPARRQWRKTRACELLRRSRGRPSMPTQVLPAFSGATAVHEDLLAPWYNTWWGSITRCLTQPTSEWCADLESAVSRARHMWLELENKCSDSHELFLVQNDDECSASVASKYFLTVIAAMTGALLRRRPDVMSGTVSHVGKLPRRDSSRVVQQSGDSSQSAEHSEHSAAQWTLSADDEVSRVPSSSLCRPIGNVDSAALHTIFTSTLVLLTFLQPSRACSVMEWLLPSSAILCHRRSFSSKCFNINNPSEDDANRCHSMNSGRTMNEMKPKTQSTSFRFHCSVRLQTC